MHRRSPHVACWLNFFPDHLDHYDGDLGAYWADKLGITAHQRPDDWIVLPWSDHRLRDLATAARRSYFGATIDGPFEDGCHLRDGRIVLRRGGADRPVARLAELPTELRVPHHVELVLAATACAAAHGADPGLIGPALASFHGITHRFERIGAWRGIQFINDSAATTPESVALALRATARPTVLIFGGGGRKGLSYRHLAPVAARHAQTIVLFADDGPSVELARRLPPGTDTVTVVDMAQAVRAGAGALLRRGGGTLLLSSGCSGAPFYPDLFVRGETFRDCFRALVRGGAG
jgi:UDP-N-acetylmuramoylalanine--D-glutamate ligase